jgi:hypothetical protein
VTRIRHEVDAPGQDSFLDVVANLVGILIILVMIVGTRAKNAIQQAEHAPESIPLVDVESPKNAAVAVRQELETMLERTQQQAIEIAYRRNERDRILTFIAAAENAMEKETNKLSDDQRKAHEVEIQLAAARREQADLKMAREAVERTEAPVTIVKHRPTPLAKTVFGKEVHFRLQAGRIVYLPIDELAEMFKAEAKEKTWKLKQSPQITETVGPYRGFQLRYTLKRATYNMESRAGVVVQERVELDHFVLVPVQDDLGETLDQALRPDSDMRSVLAGFDPNQATVTVWVYPDSFEPFRVLKEELYKLGYLTASRPMPEGQPITGSPQGTRSAVE